jgi:hypothetical protein
MAQLLEMLSTRPEIICILLFWPFLLWVLKVISQKVLFKYESK